jgi:hypothetical protein
LLVPIEPRQSLDPADETQLVFRFMEEGTHLCCDALRDFTLQAKRLLFLRDIALPGQHDADQLEGANSQTDEGNGQSNAKTVAHLSPLGVGQT